MSYEDEFHAIEAIMEEVTQTTVENDAMPIRVRFAEQALASASPELQQDVATATDTPVELLRAVLGQNFASVIMQHLKGMESAGLATIGLVRPAPRLVPLRSVAEKLLAATQARNRILKHLAQDEHGLLANVVISEPNVH